MAGVYYFWHMDRIIELYNKFSKSKLTKENQLEYYELIELVKAHNLKLSKCSCSYRASLGQIAKLINKYNQSK